jgi:hypothetical protein
LQVEPASLGFHDADGRVESDKPVRILLHIVQVGPDGQTDISRPEPTYRTTARTMSVKRYYQCMRTRRNSLRVNVEGHRKVGSSGKRHIVLQGRRVPDQSPVLLDIVITGSSVDDRVVSGSRVDKLEDHYDTGE